MSRMAIGTGETATPEQAQEVHLLIRQLLTGLSGKDVADLCGSSMAEVLNRECC